MNGGSPTDYLADYGISIKLRDGMKTNPVISGILQELVNVFKGWFDDELVIEDVNNMKLSEDRFESIHFLLATLGLEYL